MKEGVKEASTGALNSRQEGITQEELKFEANRKKFVATEVIDGGRSFANADWLAISRTFAATRHFLEQTIFTRNIDNSFLRPPTATMETANVRELLEDLEVNIDELETALEPLLTKPVAQTANSLPLLDRAKLYVNTVYTIENLIFNALKVAGIDPAAHPVKTELHRVRQYFEKIKEAENPTARNLTLNKEAAGRFIKAALSGNDRFDIERTQKIQKEKEAAQKKLTQQNGKKRKSESASEDAGQKKLRKEEKPRDTVGEQKRKGDKDDDSSSSSLSSEEPTPPRGTLHSNLKYDAVHANIAHRTWPQSEVRQATNAEIRNCGGSQERPAANCPKAAVEEGEQDEEEERKEEGNADPGTLRQAQFSLKQHMTIGHTHSTYGYRGCAQLQIH
jgi:exosome complex protein LRP1